MSDSEPQISDPAPPAIAGTPDQPAAPAIDTQPIVARGGMYYRNTRYIMAALTVVMGFWFGYDGFVRWPAEHQKVVELTQEVAQNPDPALKDALKGLTDHTDTDIRLQCVLAFSLPPLGILLLIWALYNSRGEYRLADETLYLPGHPPVPLTAVRELDQTAWDRKGIARVSYELPDGKSGTAKLDDFVYDRNPTDKIYDQIKSHLQPPAAVATESAEDATQPAQGVPPV